MQIAMHSFCYLVIIVTNHNNFNFHDAIPHFEPGLVEIALQFAATSI